MAGFFLTDWLAHPSHIPVVGNLFGKTPEEQQVEDKLGQLSQSYQQYRPVAEQAGVNTLSSQLGAFGPANQAIGDVYGSKYMQNLAGMEKSPLPAGATQVGNPQAAGPPAGGGGLSDAIKAALGKSPTGLY
jgi:hypothetical protein